MEPRPQPQKNSLRRPSPSPPDEHELANPEVAVQARRRVERRRPGRMASVSPELIPLLRGQSEPEPDANDPLADDLTAATGIAVASLFSGLLWGLVLWIV